MIGLNIGSGQRRFESVDGMRWVNVDKSPRENPDIIRDVLTEPLPVWREWDDLSESGTQYDYVVLHQVLEHFHLGPEVDRVLSECYRVLKPGGSLLIFVPDMKALVRRWMTKEIDDYIFMVNVYGAWQGEEGDDHHWGWTGQSLWTQLKRQPWRDVHAFNWRVIPGADLARDWWVLAMEAVK